MCAATPILTLSLGDSSLGPEVGQPHSENEHLWFARRANALLVRSGNSWRFDATMLLTQLNEDAREA
jgi:hypothetical protein